LATPFWKYHALGNDYLVLNPERLEMALQPFVIQRLCHRHFGVGSDGILLGPLPAPEADFGLRIFNPDGSEAEKSGNGLRIFARYLWDEGQVGEAPFYVQTLGGRVRAQVQQAGRQVEVDMGQVSFQSRLIPVAGPDREVIQEPIEVQGQTFTFSAATIGNPHCVIVVPETLQLWRRPTARPWKPIPISPSGRMCSLCRWCPRIGCGWRFGSGEQVTLWLLGVVAVRLPL